MITGRVVGLRPLEDDDAIVLRDLANDPQTRGLVVGWDWPVSVSGQRKWLEATRQDLRTRRFAVVDRSSGEMLGVTGFWDIDWHNRSALTAVKLLSSRTRKGAGSDTIMLVNALAFYEVGLNRLWGAILPFNEASNAAYVGRCGWKLEGRERESVFRNGQWHDLLRVAILRRDFDALPLSQEYVRYVCPIDTAVRVSSPE